MGELGTCTVSGVTPALPRTEATPLIRTDFADEAAWRTLGTSLAAPTEDGFLPDLSFIDDDAYRDMAPDRLLDRVPEDFGHSILIVADRTALSSAELPLLVIDLWDEPGRAIRVVAGELWGIENNLSLANMDFYEFADAAEPDGVFRGF